MEAIGQRRALWKVEKEARRAPRWCGYLDWYPEDEYDDPTYPFYDDDEWQRRRQEQRRRYKDKAARSAEERLMHEYLRVGRLLDPVGESRRECRGTLNSFPMQPMPSAERKVRRRTCIVAALSPRCPQDCRAAACRCSSSTTCALQICGPQWVVCVCRACSTRWATRSTPQEPAGLRQRLRPSWCQSTFKGATLRSARGCHHQRQCRRQHLRQQNSLHVSCTLA